MPYSLPPGDVVSGWDEVAHYLTSSLTLHSLILPLLDSRAKGWTLYVDGSRRIGTREDYTHVSRKASGREGGTRLTRGNVSNTLFSTELATVKDYTKRFFKQMDKTTEIGQSF